MFLCVSMSAMSVYVFYVCLSVYVYLYLSMSIYLYLCLFMSIVVYLCLFMAIFFSLCLYVYYVYLCLSMSISVYVYLCLFMFHLCLCLCTPLYYCHSSLPPTSSCPLFFLPFCLPIYSLIKKLSTSQALHLSTHPAISSM